MKAKLRKKFDIVVSTKPVFLNLIFLGGGPSVRQIRLGYAPDRFRLFVQDWGMQTGFITLRIRSVIGLLLTRKLPG
jgi:hypothetical protein